MTAPSEDQKITLHAVGPALHEAQLSSVYASAVHGFVISHFNFMAETRVMRSKEF